MGYGPTLHPRPIFSDSSYVMDAVQSLLEGLMETCAQYLPALICRSVYGLSLSFFRTVTLPRQAPRMQTRFNTRQQARTKKPDNGPRISTKRQRFACQEQQAIFALFWDAPTRPFGSRETCYLLIMARIIRATPFISAIPPRAPASPAPPATLLKDPHSLRQAGRDPLLPLLLAIVCLATCRLPQQVCASLDVIHSELGADCICDPISQGLAYIILTALPIHALPMSPSLSLPDRAKIRALVARSAGLMSLQENDTSQLPALCVPDCSAASYRSLAVPARNTLDGEPPHGLRWCPRPELRFFLTNRSGSVSAQGPACTFEAKLPQRQFVRAGAGRDCALDFALALSTELTANLIDRRSAPNRFRSRLLERCEGLVSKGFCASILESMRHLTPSADRAILALRQALCLLDDQPADRLPPAYREGEWGSEDDSALDLSVRGTCTIGRTQVMAHIIRLTLLLLAPYSTVYVLRAIRDRDTNKTAAVHCPPALVRPAKPRLRRANKGCQDNPWEAPEYFFAEAPLGGDLSLDFRPAERGWDSECILRLPEETKARLEDKAERLEEHLEGRRVWLGSRGRVWRERTRVISAAGIQGDESSGRGGNAGSRGSSAPTIGFMAGRAVRAAGTDADVRSPGMEKRKSSPIGINGPLAPGTTVRAPIRAPVLPNPTQEEALLDFERVGSWDVARTREQLPDGLDYLTLDVPVWQNKGLPPHWVHIAASDFLDLEPYLEERGLEIVSVCKVVSPYHSLITECPRWSHCSPNCSVRGAQQGKMVPLELVRQVDGWALQTCNYVPKGAFLGTLSGELLLRDQAKPRLAILDALGYNLTVRIPGSRECRRTGSSQTAGSRAALSASSSQGFVLDRYSVGNESIFIHINHDPTAEVRPVLWNCGSTPQLCLFATRDLVPGDEVTVAPDFLSPAVAH